jgi:hypothetical protein
MSGWIKTGHVNKICSFIRPEIRPRRVKGIGIEIIYSGPHIKLHQIRYQKRLQRIFLFYKWQFRKLRPVPQNIEIMTANKKYASIN